MEDVFYSFNPMNIPMISGEISNKGLAESTNQKVKNMAENKYYKSMKDINVTANSRIFFSFKE